MRRREVGEVRAEMQHDLTGPGGKVRIKALIESVSELGRASSISGYSSAVERYPSKLDVVGSIPIARSNFPKIGRNHRYPRYIPMKTAYWLRIRV